MTDPTPSADAGNGTRRRVLVSAGPMFGHINTVLPMARAAVRAGHDVIVATGPDMVDHVRGHGVEAVAAGPTFAGSRAEHDDRWLELFVGAARRRAYDLVPVATAWRPDLVIHEETELAGAVAATVTGAQHVVHGLGLMPPMRIWDELVTGLDDIGRQWHAPDVAERLAGATYLDVCPPALQPGHESLWTRVQPVRPTQLTARAGDASARLLDSIASMPFDRTVHVTLGTVFNERNPVLAMTIAALRELDVNVVATSGPGSDPQRFGAQPSNVVIEPYLPHALLLPRCSLVVSQGGAGVLFAALSHGLPQLVIPQGADQFANAEACERAGAGIALSGAEVDERAIAGTARELLEAPEYAAAAAAVCAQIEAMPTVDDAFDAIDGSTRQRPDLEGGH